MLTHRFGAIASNSNGVTNLCLGIIDEAGAIVSAHVALDAALSIGAQAQTVSLDVWRNGAKLTTAATLALAASASLAAMQRYEFTLSATYSNTLIAAGDMLVLNYTQGSSGQALPAGLVHVDNTQKKHVVN